MSYRFLIQMEVPAINNPVAFEFCCSDCSISSIIYGRCTATCAEYIMLDPFSLQQMDRSGTLWLKYMHG